MGGKQVIPILYESSETAFVSNGLGRLRDCITAKVAEERNGIYELDFDYPVNGAHYEDIIPGRIVAVTHDDTGDVQPFDVVSFTRPIGGVVTFHCVHISYRQSGIVASGTSINSLADAFTMLEGATPSNPFNYSTDITSTAYMAAADGTPRSVRQFLGGIEGSILDAYGGEYEWDKFQVILHKNRGITRDWSIRYGVNLLNYDEQSDYLGSFTSCVPYWIGADSDGAEVKVIGNQVDSGLVGYTGRIECVPLDLTDKFETKPTTAQLESEALAQMQAKQVNLPSQNIAIDFVRLQDLGYEEYGQLMECRLCDTIGVVFPFYNTTGQYKIVKTVWDVLADRFDSLELGSLSTTLSEALGITTALDKANGIDQVVAQVDALDNRVDALETAYITAQGESGEWKYRKWSNGFQEAWCVHSFGAQTAAQWAGSVYYKDVNLAIPSGIFTTDDVKCLITGAGLQWWGVGYSSTTKTQITSIRFCRVNANSNTLWGSFYCYAQA